MIGFEEWYKKELYREEASWKEDYDAVNQYDDKSIMAFVYKWFYPKRPRKNWLCRIGIHRYRGYNKYQSKVGGATKFTGVCTRCGKLKRGNWQECSM